jgi:hypothetical protein
MTPESAATELLARIGKKTPSAVTPIPGGRNNTVWRVDSGSETFLLKRYFWSESDPRDRLGQEWTFLEFLHSIGSRQAPAPLARLPESRFALLEFIPGTPPSDIAESDILAAADFLAEINSRRHQATHIPPVSEAAFSIDQHLAVTAHRITSLTRIQPLTSDHTAAISFVESTLLPLWHSIHTRIENIPATTRTSILPPTSRILSPSDFGFHNALRQPDRTLRYVDFEYAGWDDPAKTLIDFTNQPDRILPDHLATLFLENTIPHLPDPTPLRTRISILTPLYQLKWACICLNAFLPGRPADPARPLPHQLARARTSALRAEGKRERRREE